MLFNPYAWGTIIGFCILTALGGYYKGWHMRGVQAEAELSRAYAQALKTQQDNQNHLNDTVTRYETQKKQIDASMRTLRIDVNNAANRVFISTNLPAANNTSNAAATTGDTTQCELDRKTATNLIDIAQDGDNAIIQLNALIDFYQGLKP
jgi:prophage endopeptidase